MHVCDETILTDNVPCFAVETKMCRAMAAVIDALKALETRGQQLATTYWAERTECTFEGVDLLTTRATEELGMLMQELVAVTDRVPPDSVLLSTGRCSVCETCAHAVTLELPTKGTPWPLWCALWCAWTNTRVRGLTEPPLAVWTLPVSCADMVTSLSQRWMQHGAETRQEQVFNFGVRLMRPSFF